VVCTTLKHLLFLQQTDIVDVSLMSVLAALFRNSSCRFCLECVGAIRFLFVVVIVIIMRRAHGFKSIVLQGAGLDYVWPVFFILRLADQVQPFLGLRCWLLERLLRFRMFGGVVSRS